MHTFASLAIATLLMAAAASPLAAADQASADAPTKGAADAPRSGQVIRDANGRRLGPIQSIRDGDAIVIVDMQMHKVPLATLTIGKKGWQTTMLRSQLN